MAAGRRPCGLWLLPAMPVLWLLTNPAVPLDSYLADSIPTAPADAAEPAVRPGPRTAGTGAARPDRSGAASVLAAIGVLFYRFLTATR